MIINVLIVLAAILVILVAVFVGVCIGVGHAVDDFEKQLSKDEDFENEHLYCFQCEIEMPVKEKKGNLYCKNCGMIHRNL